MMDEKDPLTGAVIAAAIEVHREMGPGLLESVYQSCLEEEFKIRGIDCLAQHRLPLVYKGRTLSDEFVLDFYFPDRLVVELKAVERIIPVFEAQLLSYLRLTRTRVGLLLNFNAAVMRDGIKRMVL
jgi:GxxExxY protein